MKNVLSLLVIIGGSILNIAFVQGQSIDSSKMDDKGLEAAGIERLKTDNDSVRFIKGTIIDADTKEPVSFASIVVLRNGIQVTGTVADIDGHFLLSPLNRGSFDLKISFVGYNTSAINNILLSDWNYSMKLNLRQNAKSLQFRDFRDLRYVPSTDTNVVKSKM